MRTATNKSPLPQRVDDGALEKPLNLRIQWFKAQLRAFLAEVDALADFRDLDIQQGINFQEEVRRFEIDLIRLALRQTGGHQRRASILLKMKRSTLHAKIKLYRISVSDLRDARQRDEMEGPEVLA